MNVVVLISGGGTNLQALIDGQLNQTLPITIQSVISNKADAYGLERAKQAGINTDVLDHKAFESREAFDQAMIKIIDQYEPKLVILAGFMRILTPEFTRHYLGRMINIHPSLLPKYQGLHTHKRAIEAGDSEHGCSVHFVTEELDGGPVAMQAVVPIETTDTPEDLAARVLTQEHIIFPETVKLFAEGRLTMGEESAILDGKELPNHGLRINNFN
ncbi:phosphoribosylglycinamide formyltransferase [Litoribrevibacter albus]|uniref:Phosphoribosylglycinamide formyltransferase n=1 Tax=Litoribrevibacter albus TaxID=1473156 RepID=A0AA37W886_9GAMM|nr:phosphoribosylglycinamide formyltransferase [Litoribrevibacter albus]GLQ32173.1 phosphoribosylglycinamide formyltransferase [Litoribrevibacter albus]